MNKYIFLDIDGVIATPETLEDGMWGLTKRCQDLLGRILNETNANIVLSSSKRLNRLDDTIKYMKDEGFEYYDKIIGITIRAYQYLDRTKSIHLSIPRGVEIKQWIDTHVHSNNGKDYNRKQLKSDYNYIILDDDSDMLLEQKDNFIQCDSMLGLNEELTLKAIQILNSN